MFLTVLPWQATLPASTNWTSPEQSFLWVSSMPLTRQPVSLSSVNNIIRALWKCLTKESPINSTLETRSDNNWQACLLVKFLNWQPEEGTNSFSSATTVFLKSVHLSHAQVSFPDPHVPDMWLQHGDELKGSHREGMTAPKSGASSGNMFPQCMSCLCNVIGNPRSFLILMSRSLLWSSSPGRRSWRGRHFPFRICRITSLHLVCLWIALIQSLATESVNSNWCCEKTWNVTTISSVVKITWKVLQLQTCAVRRNPGTESKSCVKRFKFCDETFTV